MVAKWLMYHFKSGKSWSTSKEGFLEVVKPLSSAFKGKWELKVEGGFCDAIMVLLPDINIGGARGAHSRYLSYLRGDPLYFCHITVMLFSPGATSQWNRLFSLPVP